MDSAFRRTTPCVERRERLRAAANVAAAATIADDRGRRARLVDGRGAAEAREVLAGGEGHVAGLARERRDAAQARVARILLGQGHEARLEAGAQHIGDARDDVAQQLGILRGRGRQRRRPEGSLGGEGDTHVRLRRVEAYGEPIEALRQIGVEGRSHGRGHGELHERAALCNIRGVASDEELIEDLLLVL